MGMILFLGCQKELHKEIIFLNQQGEEKYSVMGNEAQFGFITGRINAAIIKPGDMMLVRQVDISGWWTEDTLEYGEFNSTYLHHPYTNGFAINIITGTFYNYCSPLNTTHIFLDPIRNHHGTNYWPLEHLKQHQRVWHYTDNPGPGPAYCWGVWDDFRSSTPNSPSEQ